MKNLLFRQGSFSLRQGRMWGILLVILLLAFLSSAVYGQEAEMRIGVLALRGDEDAVERWTPTAEYLTEQIPAYRFVIVPLDFEEIYHAVEEGDVDFVLANSGIYVDLEYKYGVDRIATLQEFLNGQAFAQFGGVIFTLQDRDDIENLDDLKMKRLAAVDDVSFGGWRMAQREFLAQDIDPFRDFVEVEFWGTHDAVVYAVLGGEADAGTVRTGILERMDAEGKIDLADFLILNSRFPPDNFPLAVSTRLYPEWPFARVAHTPDDISQQVSIALLSMSPENPAAVGAGVYGWTIPFQYQSVHDCLKELRVSPYESLGKITFADLLRQYGGWLLAAVIVGVGLVVVTMYVSRLNRELNVKTLALKEANDMLEERVEARTLALKESNQQLLQENRERRRAEDKLRKSEERYRSIYERVKDVIYETDFQGTITGISPSIEKHSGYRPDEVIGKNVTEFFTYLDEYTALNEKMNAAGSVNDFELQLRLKNGGIRFISVTAHIVFDENGQPYKTEGVLRDITERVQAEKSIQKHLARLDSLRQIDKAITGSLDLKITLDVLLEQVVERLKVDATAILLYQKETHGLTLFTERGFRTKLSRNRMSRLGKGCAGRVALEKREFFVSDLSTVDENISCATLFREEDFVVYYGLPLIAKGNLTGVLEIFHRSELQPDQVWMDYSRTLAGQAAIAIDNITLFDNLQRSNIKLMQAYDATIEGWAHALELKDMEVEGHSRRVVDLTIALAKRLNIRGEKLLHLRRGALLHDIGKMGVPDNILLKPGPLTPEEEKIMQQHPLYAYEWLSPIEYLKPALDIPYCHHEHWDGTGFPRGLSGERIPLAARIFTIVDVWDALTSDRPYRKAWSRQKTKAYLQEKSGTHFEPRIVSAFLEYLEEEG